MLPDLMIHARQTALQDCEHTLRGVDVDVATAVLACAVIHRAMCCEHVTDAGVRGKLVGAEMGATVNVLADDFAQVFTRDSLHGKAANFPATLHERHNRSAGLASCTSPELRFPFASDIRFVSLNNSLQFGAE